MELNFPGHPAGVYARAAIAYAHMVDLEDTVGRAEFMMQCDSCVELCDNMRMTGAERRSVISYLKGSALGARGLLLNHEGRVLPALKALIKAKNAFEDAIRADPEFYDAYLGRGAYRYAVATHASLLHWLPFIPSKASGWQDLWLAAQRSGFSRSTALTSIVWHTMDEGDFAAADTIIESQLIRFPGCRNFLWPKLAFYERQDRWAEAEQTAKLLLEQYLAHPDNNGYEPIGLYWRMMTCADELSRPEDAKSYARAGLQTYRTPDVAERRAGKLREMQTRLSNP
jgi:tetratricopeptide (TPR) repeat protein